MLISFLPFFVPEMILICADRKGVEDYNENRRQKLA